MADVTQTRCVHGERPVIKGRRYDLGIYAEDEQFYATWYCSECLQRNETQRFVSQILAYQDAEDAMFEHSAIHEPEKEAL